MNLTAKDIKKYLPWIIVAILAIIALKYIFTGAKKTTYDFFHGVDSPDGDIDYRPDLRDNIPQLIKACNEHPRGCVGFNTEGYLKSKIKPESEWKAYMTTKDKGLYVKKSVYKKLNN